MNRPRVLCVCVILSALSAALGCSQGQKLVGITVSPQNTSISGGPLNVNYTAYGVYTHPPENRDLTHSVVWTSSSPEVISIDPTTGIATSSSVNCGTNILITATLYSKPGSPTTGTVATGTATANVKNPGCTA